MLKEKYVTLGKKPSAIRTLFEYGKVRKAEIGEDKVFDFSIGNPNAPAPECVKNSLIDLLNNDSSFHLHGYTSSVGDLKVRQAIASFLNEKYHANTDEKLIYVSSGAAPSLAIIFNCVVNKGDEVITFAPHWPDYRVLIEQVEGVIIEVKPEHTHFYPDFDDLLNKISDKTKAVVINSPNNPTGTVYDEAVIKRLSEILSNKQKEYGHPIYLVSDEPYRELLYKDEEYPFITNYYDNSIVCYSFSKSLSLPGERIGYILVNPKCESVNDVFAVICGSASMLGYICAPALFQHMVPYVLGHTSNLEEYKKNKETLVTALKEIGFEIVNPTGAFYLFMKALEPDAEKFSEVAKQFELLLVPSDPFDYKGYVRIAYCVSYKQIVNSITAFKKLYNYYKNR